ETRRSRGRRRRLERREHGRGQDPERERLQSHGRVRVERGTFVRDVITARCAASGHVRRGRYPSTRRERAPYYPRPVGPTPEAPAAGGMVGNRALHRVGG